MRTGKPVYKSRLSVLVLLLLLLTVVPVWQKIRQRSNEQWRQSASLADLADTAKRGGGDVDLYRQLGLRQRDAGQFFHAEQSLQQAVQLAPDNETLWHDWAVTVGVSRGAAAQMLVLAAWQKTLPQSAWVRAEMAQVQYLAGNYASAEKLAREATQIDSERAEGWQVRGQLALIRQDWKEAEDDFRQARAKAPKDWRGSLGLTKVALQKADGTAAVRAARDMIALVPDEPVAKLYLAQALLKRPLSDVSPADVAEARQLLMSALKSSQSLVGESRYDALLALGDSYAERTAWTDAVPWFEQAQVVAPGSVKVQTRLVHAYKETRQAAKEKAARLRFKASAAYQEAAQTLRLKIAAFPKDGTLRLQLAHLYAQNGNYIDAARTYQLMIAQQVQADDARREYAALTKGLGL